MFCQLSQKYYKILSRNFLVSSILCTLFCAEIQNKKNTLYSTGCASHFGNPTNFTILKEPLLVHKQRLHQQKALDLSFNLTP